MIDVTFTLLPLGHGTSRPAPLTSCKVLQTHRKGRGEVWGSGRKRGQATNKVFVKCAKNTPTWVVCFLFSHLLIKNLWIVSWWEDYFEKKRLFVVVLSAVLFPYLKQWLDDWWWMKGKVMETSLTSGCDLTSESLSSRESFIVLTHSFSAQFTPRICASSSR